MVFSLIRLLAVLIYEPIHILLLNLLSAIYALPVKLEDHFGTQNLRIILFFKKNTKENSLDSIYSNSRWYMYSFLIIRLRKNVASYSHKKILCYNQFNL